MEVTLRRLTIQDAALLCEFSKKTFSDSFIHTCLEEDMEWYLNKTYTIDGFEKELDNANFYAFGAFDNETLAGFIKYKANQEPIVYFKGYKTLEVKSLYVHTPYHGKGVAQKLMQNYFDFAISHHYEFLYLSVWEYNFKAQTFYKKYGFDYSGFTNDFPIGNTPQTDLWYCRKL